MTNAVNCSFASSWNSQRSLQMYFTPRLFCPFPFPARTGTVAFTYSSVAKCLISVRAELASFRRGSACDGRKTVGRRAVAASSLVANAAEIRFVASAAVRLPETRLSLSVDCDGEIRRHERTRSECCSLLALSFCCTNRFSGFSPVKKNVTEMSYFVSCGT